MCSAIAEYVFHLFPLGCQPSYIFTFVFFLASAFFLLTLFQEDICTGTHDAQ